MEWGILIFGIFLLLSWKAIHDVRLANEYTENVRRYEHLQKYKTRKILENVDPRRFEFIVADVFKKYGYEAEVTKGSNDGGKDIILRKGNILELVEVKRYCKSTIGRPLIQKLHSAIVDAKAGGGYFVTLSDFNRNARQYAARHNIKLIDGNDLIRMMHK